MADQVSKARQSRIERRFTEIANMHADDSPLPEILLLLRDLFEYVEEIEKKLTAVNQG